MCYFLGTVAQARPYYFQDVSKWSSEEASLHLSFLNGTKSSSILSTAVSLLNELLNEKVSISNPKFSSIENNELDKYLAQRSTFALYTSGDLSECVILEIDLSLSHWIVDILLGGKGKISTSGRGLSEMEKGVLSFAFLKAANVLGNEWSGPSMSLISIEDSISDYGKELENALAFQMITTQIKYGNQKNYIRLLVSNALIKNHFNQNIEQSLLSFDSEIFDRRIKILGPQNNLCRLKIAELDLEPEDLTEVEPGDIIVMDKHQCSIANDSLQGKAELLIGQGSHGQVSVQFNDNNNISGFTELKILDISSFRQPEAIEQRDKNMSDESEEIVEDLSEVEDISNLEEESSIQSSEPQEELYENNLAETEGLLQDVPAPVVIELGRLRMNTHQVIQLRKGQILKLARSPRDPVNLVVNGKLYARGEIVEVEGELGVRLTEVS